MKTIRLPNLKLSAIQFNGKETQLELDSHADTCVLGSGALIFLDHNRPVQVLGYDTTLGSKTFKTVSGALAYDHPDSGQTYHLVIHQAIHIPHLGHHLLNPFQTRVNDIHINELPKFQAMIPNELNHAIMVPDPDKTDTDLTFPMYLDGIISFLPVRMPTTKEWDSNEFPRIDLTSRDLEWDPYSKSYAEQEDAAARRVTQVQSVSSIPAAPSFRISSMSSMSNDAVCITDDENFAQTLESHICVSLSSVHTHQTPGTVRSKPRPAVDHMTLSRRWNIPPAR